MSDEKEKRPSWDTPESEVTNRIFTAANVVSFIRLCMVPVYLVLLLDGHDILATFIFALAASTDFIDGQLARRTHTVSRLGRLLDPAVDRALPGSSARVKQHVMRCLRELGTVWSRSIIRPDARAALYVQNWNVSSRPWYAHG